uniref:Uncharacterized protein n=1 Tax=Propithecus coquereli TaxID=379532 RepID=A0A2K6EEP3_PROCO
LFLTVREAGKCKSCFFVFLLPLGFYWCTLRQGRSVQWQAGLRCNGGEDFTVSLVRTKAAEGLGN